MTNASLNDDPTLIIANRATGYEDRADPAIRAELKSIGIATHAGTEPIRLPRIASHYGGSGVFASIEDLAKWSGVFTDNRLGAAFTTQMLAREKFEHEKDNDAFGLVFGSFEGRAMIWFSGADLDTSTFMARLPDEQLTVICLSNRTHGDAEGKAKEVLRLLKK